MKRIAISGINGRGKFAIVDDEDFEMVSGLRWFMSPQGYARRRAPGTTGNVTLLMHRLINRTADGLQTDHINGDRLDNRRANLRSCSAAENAMNRGAAKNNSSGARGVSFIKSHGLFAARIRVRRRLRFLGYFKTVAEASASYERAAAEAFGAFCRPAPLFSS